MHITLHLEWYREFCADSCVCTCMRACLLACVHACCLACVCVVDLHYGSYLCNYFNLALLYNSFFFLLSTTDITKLTARCPLLALPMPEIHMMNVH